jgi:ABC-type Mn2+/Zn2+ transport system permease subunit
LSDIAFWWSLLREGIIASIAAGVVIPLVGALLFMRRSALLGLAVPQFSAAGLAFGLFLLPLFPAIEQEFLDHGHPPMLYSLAFAAVFAALSLSGFAALSSRFREYKQAATAAGFSLALAVTVLLLNAAPAGAQLADSLLRGEIILLDAHGMYSLLAVCLIVLVMLVILWRWLLLVAFDPEQAVVLGHSVIGAERWQVVLIGIAVGGGVVTIGPMLVFALLFLPPLFAVSGKAGVLPYLRRTIGLSLFSVLASWPISIELDMPYGSAASLVCLFSGLLWLLISKLLKN